MPGRRPFCEEIIGNVGGSRTRSRAKKRKKRQVGEQERLMIYDKLAQGIGRRRNWGFLGGGREEVGIWGIFGYLRRRGEERNNLMSCSSICCMAWGPWRGIGANMSSISISLSLLSNVPYSSGPFSIRIHLLSPYPISKSNPDPAPDDRGWA